MTTSAHLLSAEADAVLKEADCLYTHADVEAAMDHMATNVSEALRGSSPLLLAVMIGGLIPAAKLLARLDLPLEVDYIHATRYREGVTGSSIEWRARPRREINDRVVLVVDDILDEGLTLSAVIDYCRAEGARKIYSAVLVEKQHQRKPTIQHADFAALRVEDRYVFGSGMDYKGYLRNVPGIYAVKGL